MALSAQDFEDGLGRHFPRGLHSGQEDRAAGARWATSEEIGTANWRFGGRPGMMFLGYRNGSKVGRFDDRHQLTIGGSRAGKGVSLIVPTLLTYEGSVLAIDPKGELARLTSGPRAKRLGQHCIVLDPFGASGLPSQNFNPLAEIKRSVPEVPGVDWPFAVDDALMIADAMIVMSGTDSHWTDSAKSVLQALILMTLELPEHERNLLTVRNLLMLKDRSVIAAAENFGGDREKALFAIMEAEPTFNGVIAGIGSQFLSMGDRERGSILSTARTQTAFLDSPSLASTLQKSDFALADLKQQKTTLYLCLPASNMATHAKWLRTIINLGLKECERIAAPPPLPVLFVLDEFAVLGHMRAIESAAGQMAGFGVKLWTILQDLSQLKHNYQGTWETFFGNAAIATFHGVSDMTTLEYLSKRLGTRSFTVATSTGAGLNSVVQGAALTSETVRAEPLLATHEIELALARERGRIVVLFPGSHPLILQRAIYYEDAFFKERMA
jgi:type IV secretion system protein VirD4